MNTISFDSFLYRNKILKVLCHHPLEICKKKGDQPFIADYVETVPK